MASVTRIGFPVPERTLVRRLRRALRWYGERLLMNRGGHFYTVGRYFTVDDRNIMTDHNVDLEALGRELRVMRDWERLADDQGAQQIA